MGCIAVFPQVLVPTLMKLSGDVAPLWFVALHLRAEWQWPVIFAMFAIGAFGFAVAGRIVLTELRAART
ncbi:hypothetical protein GCM10022384_32960 [Streptomyces marokkonensis]|uniref:Uncharacterized protein n=1 Tax=Streptomyces marokkonensis TaxID=324855 RepID=A0ABP7QEH3_9ACTN